MAGSTLVSDFSSPTFCHWLGFLDSIYMWAKFSVKPISHQSTISHCTEASTLKEESLLLDLLSSYFDRRFGFCHSTSKEASEWKHNVDL